MDLTSRITDFFNKKKQQVIDAAVKAPSQLQSFGQNIVNTVRSQPFINLPTSVLPNPKATPGMPTIGQAYDNMVKPSVNNIIEGSKAYGRLTPQGKIIQKYAPQSDYAARPGLMNYLKDVWSVGKAGATIYGLNKLTPGITATSALLSGGLNKLGGGSLTEGAMQGVGTSPVLSGIGNVTNPLISKASNYLATPFKNPIAQSLINRGATGLANIPEGMIMKSGLTTDPYGATDALLDAGVGFLTGSPRSIVGKGMVMRKEYPKIIPKIEENIKDVIVRYAKTFGEASDPRNPTIDLNLENDVVQVWKTIFGDKPLPKDFTGISLDRMIGDIKEGYNGFKTEQEMLGQGIRMGIDGKNDAKAGLYDVTLKQRFPNATDEELKALQQAGIGKSVEQGPKGFTPLKEKLEGPWRGAFDKTNNLHTRTDILRAIASISNSAKELDDIAIRAKGLPDEANILRDVELRKAGLQSRVAQPNAGLYDTVKLYSGHDSQKGSRYFSGHRGYAAVHGKNIREIGIPKDKIFDTRNPEHMAIYKSLGVDNPIDTKVTGLPKSQGDARSLEKALESKGYDFDAIAMSEGTGQPGLAETSYFVSKKATPKARTSPDPVKPAEKPWITDEELGRVAQESLVGAKPDLIKQTQPGDYSNVRDIDPRISEQFKASKNWKEYTPDQTLPLGSEIKMENGKQFARQPQSVGSILDEIKGGFEGGRRAREQAEKAKAGTLGQRARAQLLDRLSPVYDFIKGKGLKAEDDPYKRMRLLAGTGGKIEAFIDKNISPILKKEQKRLSDLSALLVIDRERELIGRGLTRKRNIDQLDQAVAELKTKYGADFDSLVESAQEMRKVGNQLLDQLKESGIIDDDSYNAIRKNNEFYTPFEAVEHLTDQLEKGLYGTGSFNVASQDVVKRIGDYTGDVADPIEALVRKIPKVISLIEKNKAMQSFVNLRNIDPEYYGNLIQKVKGDKVSEGMSTINVFENGQNVKYAVPEVISRAIKNLDAESGGILLKLGSIQAKMLRTGATALNIGFIPVNIIRDVQDAMTTEISENGVKSMLSFLASYPRAIYSAAKRDDLYREWAKSGGLNSTMTEQIFKKTPKTVRELSGQKPKLLTRLNPIRNAKELVEFANRVGEQSTRLARFSSGLKRGESLTEAAFKSRDISLDFSKAGNSVKVLNQVIPFLNAGIQGSEKLLRLYKNNPKAAIASTGVMFGIPTVMLFSHNSQFEDYDDIPDAEKQTNWIILARDRTDEERAKGDSPIGIKIPKGFIGRMVSTTTESALQFMKSKDPSLFPKTAIDMAESISPIGIPFGEGLGRTLSSVLPPWIKAGVEWTTNKNLFFGSDIVPQSLENLPASEQYKDKTPGVYKMAGKLTGLSPLKLENTVNTTTGGVGRQIATLLSGDLEGGTVKQVSRRFMDIRDGKKTEDAYDMVDKEKEYTALRNKQLKEAFRKGDMKEVERLSEGMTSQQIKSLINNDLKKEQKEKLTPEQRAYETLTKEEQRRLGEKKPELKTELDIVPEATAAEETPYDYQASLVDDTKEALAKSRVEMTGKAERYKDKYFYINENGNVGTLDMDFSIKEKPESVGSDTFDKELIKDYQSDISNKQKNLVKAVKLGAMSVKEAEELYAKLEQSRGGGGRKAKTSLKFDFRQLAKALDVKPVKARITRRSTSYKPVKVQTPKPVKLLKFKGKTMKLRKR